MATIYTVMKINTLDDEPLTFEGVHTWDKCYWSELAAVGGILADMRATVASLNEGLFTPDMPVEDRPTPRDEPQLSDLHVVKRVDGRAVYRADLDLYGESLESLYVVTETAIEGSE